MPHAVYQRLAIDKQSDGVLDETAFARKERGQRDLTIIMLDENGQPLVRLGQVTTW